MLLFNCKSNAVEKPEKLIEKEVMAAIFYDLYLANAIYSTDAKYFADREVTPAKFVYQKYKIDSLQFAQNDRYYASDVVLYEKLFRSVTEKLQKDKSLIDTLIAKSPPVEVKEVVEKPLNSASELRDSLRKKRLLTGEMNESRVGN